MMLTEAIASSPVISKGSSLRMAFEKFSIWLRNAWTLL